MRLSWGFFFAIVPFALLLSGCSKDTISGQHIENEPPNVWLSSAPPEGTDSRYRIHLFWGGWDPDGEIAYYEYAITNNENGLFDPADTIGPDKWHPVWSNDSLFTFSADEWSDSSATDLVTRFERSHTFFIRAVDEQGARSREPAYRSFTSWTLSPRVRLTVPRKVGLTPALVPGITTFRWEATDFVNTEFEAQDPESIRWVLHAVDGSNFQEGIDWVRTHPDAPSWSKWHYYRTPGDSGKTWTTPPTDFGPYVFAIQAKDEAGAVTPVFDENWNVRRVLVSRRSTGPLLDVINDFIGTVRTSVVNSPVVIVDLPAGVPITFQWEASAESYGGLVSGYRYGWDIGDLSDDSQWEVDFTPFTATRINSPTRRFFFGTHTFNVEVIDNSGARSRVEVKVNIVQFTMERDLLLVDDYFEKPGGSGLVKTRGALPNDEEHDQFWLDMLSDIAGFNPASDVLEVISGQPLSITKFAGYKSVIWDTYGGYGRSLDARPLVYDLVKFRSKDPSLNKAGAGKVQPNILSLFVRAGGHLLLCGEQPLTQVINADFFDSTPRYPFLFLYELEGNQRGQYANQIDSERFVGDRSFAYSDACVDVLDVAYTSVGNLRRQIENGCGVELIRRVDPRQDGMREAVPLDPSMPRLTLRDEVAGTGKFYEASSRGLNVEMYNPPYFDFCVYFDSSRPRPCFQPFYGMGCLDTSSPIYGAPVAFWSSTNADVVSEATGAIAARSAFLAFEPFFFRPAEVKAFLDRILVDEWQLEKAP